MGTTEAPGVKGCSRCHAVKPRTPEYFHRDKNQADGMTPDCKVCRNRYHAEWRKNNPDKNRICVQHHNARRRAEEAGVPFTITRKWLTENTPTHCPILGIPLDLDTSSRETSPSLDRIVPSRGYTPENCRVISMRANRLKSDATPEEAMAVALWLQREVEEYWRDDG